MTSEEGIAFWVGAFVSALFCALIFAVTVEMWAEARNTMMTQCTERYTYESCIARWNGEKQPKGLVGKSQ